MVVVRKKSKSASASSSSSRSSAVSKKTKKKIPATKPSKKTSSNSKGTSKKTKVQVKKTPSKATKSKATVKVTNKSSNLEKSAKKNAVKRRTAKKKVSRKPRDLDVSDLEVGTSMHPRLDKLQSESGIVGEKLEKMDEELGLPPLPNFGEKPSEIVKAINKFDSNTADNNSKSKKTKKSFFAKLLGEDSKSKKPERTDNIPDANNSKDIDGSDSFIDLNYTPNFSAPEIDTDSLSPEEKKEFVKEEKELEKIEKTIKDDASKLGLDYKPDGSSNESTEQVLPHPNSVPDEFKIEKPTVREASIEFDSDKNFKKDKTGKNKKDKKSKEAKKSKNDAKNDNIMNEVVSENKKSEPLLMLPPSQAKSRKKGFFAKLFGSKSQDESSENSVSEMKKANDSPISDLGNEVKVTDSVATDSARTDNTATADAADGTNPENLSNPFDNGVSSQSEKSSYQEGKDEKKELRDSGVDSELPKPELSENISDEHSNSFLSDSIGSEMEQRSGYLEDVDDESKKEVPNETQESENGIDSPDLELKKSKSGSNKLAKDSKANVSVSTLEARKDKLRKEISELEKELGARKAEFEDKTTSMAKKEQLLDKRERDLDDRENILLTLQTDIIRERKELDKREFDFFVKSQKTSSPERPTISLSVENDLKSIPMGLSDDRMKLEQLLNQTRTLAINRDFAKAKSNYNRLVEKFHSVELTPSDKQSLHLSIKELFNDINILMSSERATHDNDQQQDSVNRSNIDSQQNDRLQDNDFNPEVESSNPSNIVDDNFKDKTSNSNPFVSE